MKRKLIQRRRSNCKPWPTCIYFLPFWEVRWAGRTSSSSTVLWIDRAIECRISLPRPVFATIRPKSPDSWFKMKNMKIHLLKSTFIIFALALIEISQTQKTTNDYAHMNSLCKKLLAYNTTIKFTYETWGTKLNTREYFGSDICEDYVGGECKEP